MTAIAAKITSGQNAREEFDTSSFAFGFGLVREAARTREAALGRVLREVLEVPEFLELREPPALVKLLELREPPALLARETELREPLAPLAREPLAPPKPPTREPLARVFRIFDELLEFPELARLLRPP